MSRAIAMARTCGALVARTNKRFVRMGNLISFYHAQLRINHEKPQSDQLKHAPAYYE